MEYYYITYGFAFITLIISLAANLFVTSSFKKYSKFNNKKDITGAEAARLILEKNGLHDIYVVETKGELTDHYDPNRKVIRLSNKVYDNRSISAVAIAAHECGHALQDSEKYVPMRIRSKIVPIVNISSYAGYVVLFIGIIMQSFNLIWAGIILEMAILIFQLITLPVEIDASKRAMKKIKDYNILDENEQNKAKTVLVAAALTYVAGVLAAILEILRLVIIYGSKRD